MTGRHHTYFDMLGNFSFNNYWKEEAIPWAWELLTEVYKLNSSDLIVTIHPQDESSRAIWLGVLECNQILEMETNVWSLGTNSSYCTEIYIDTQKEGAFDDRYLELYNLVLMDTNGYRSIDTDLGLERLCRVEDNYLTDIFIQPLNYISNLGIDSVENKRILLDHSKTITHLIKEGLVPERKGKSYILTKLIRRCLRILQVNQIDERVLLDVCLIYLDLIKESKDETIDYLSIVSKVEAIIPQEIFRFNSLLTKGRKYINLLSDSLNNVISKESMFKLNDTYGLPYDFIKEIALEQGITWDES